MNKIIDYLFHHPANLLAAVWSYVGHLFSDETYLRVRFRLLMGKWPDLKNPKTFSEKLQWLKLHDRNPEYTKMVDKLAAKQYVASLLGSEYVIPTLGVWDKAEDIEWDKLPDKFVLKTTHGAGSWGVIICKDKKTLDKKNATRKLKKSMKTEAFRTQGEWPYKNVEKKIFAEKLIETNPAAHDLIDYKWYCFNGEPKYCQVIQNRNIGETIDFFDTEWNHQEFVGLTQGVKNAEVNPEKPTNLKTQINIARQLSNLNVFTRIDLYETGNCIYFGEITFYPSSGYGLFTPDKYNYILGELLKLD